MWSALFNWTVVGAIAAILIGVGIGVLSMSPPHFSIAQVSFSVAAIALIARAGWWIVFEQQGRGAILQTGIFSFLIFGVIGALWMVSLVWVNGLRPVVAPPAEMKPAKVETPAPHSAGAYIARLIDETRNVRNEFNEMRRRYPQSPAVLRPFSMDWRPSVGATDFGADIKDGIDWHQHLREYNAHLSELYVDILDRPDIFQRFPLPGSAPRSGRAA